MSDQDPNEENKEETFDFDEEFDFESSSEAQDVEPSTTEQQPEQQPEQINDQGTSWKKSFTDLIDENNKYAYIAILFFTLVSFAGGYLVFFGPSEKENRISTITANNKQKIVERKPKETPSISNPFDNISEKDRVKKPKNVTELVKQDNNGTKPEPTKETKKPEIVKLPGETPMMVNKNSPVEAAKETKNNHSHKINKTQIMSLLEKPIENLKSEINQNNEQINDIKNNLYGEIASNSNNIDNIKSNVSSISNQVNTLDQSLKGTTLLTDKIKELSTELAALNKEIKKVEQILTHEGFETKENSHKSVEVKPEIVYSGPEYSIHAIVPGRVWLKDNSGKILSYTESDVIGNYGKLLVIDPIKNIVITESGISFK